MLQHQFRRQPKSSGCDTIVLNGEKIRFSGIDTPELKQTCMNGDEKIFCGKTAKMLLIKKIGNETPECISEGRMLIKER